MKLLSQSLPKFRFGISSNVRGYESRHYIYSLGTLPSLLESRWVLSRKEKYIHGYFYFTEEGKSKLCNYPNATFGSQQWVELEWKPKLPGTNINVLSRRKRYLKGKASAFKTVLWVLRTEYPITFPSGISAVRKEAFTATCQNGFLFKPMLFI